MADYSLNAKDVDLDIDRESLNEALRKLNQLTSFEKEAVIAQGLKEGARILAQQTKENIDHRIMEHEGNLIGSVKTLTKKKIGRSYVGFQRPKGNIAHILEFGTKQRFTKKGANRGKVKGYHFHSDALEAKGQQALNILAESINKSIEKIMNR